VSERHRTAWLVGTALVFFATLSIVWIYLDRALSLRRH
jgi:hypothetical protein